MGSSGIRTDAPGISPEATMVDAGRTETAERRERRQHRRGIPILILTVKTLQDLEIKLGLYYYYG